ncbi:MAG: single-stranded-DNA-specific exonuclease RecJ [Chitinophagales bacterium]
MEKRWVIKEVDEAQADALQKELRIHPVLCRLLIQRGITTFDAAKKFFRPALEDLHDPFIMRDMDRAVERIHVAMQRGERILIYGDYDVDGTTAVALMYSFFRNFYDRIDYYVPDRYKEGYGISIAGIDHAHAIGCTLIIALDCGIKANDKVAYASERQIDFIICDHHLPGEHIPEAFAVLDPHRPDCAYPYKELSGCGIGFKLAQAFAQQHGIPFEQVIALLDLVVVSIASDIVPITGENRVLAHFGLKQLNSAPRPGLRALIEISGYKPPLNISNLVFGLGPRINAAGRMDDATKAVRMLIAQTTEHAEDGAGHLHEKNTDRKEVDKQITAEALDMLRNDPENADRVTTVLCSSNWHKGVIGIVASRLMDHYYRPTILLTESNGTIFGSARSVKNFDVYQAILACSQYLEQFGGHMYAAGLSMRPENYTAFREAFEQIVRERITPEQRIPEIEIDAELQLRDITPSFLRIVDQFGPFGPENMQPVFSSIGLKDSGGTRIVGDNHLKLHVKDRSFFTLNGIAFQKGDFYTSINDGNSFDLCYTIEENNFKDVTQLQLNVKEIKIQMQEHDIAI